MSSSSRRSWFSVPFLALAVAFALTGAGCSGGDSGATGSAGTGGGDGVVGAFLVSLQSDFPPPSASVTGAVKSAPTNSLVIWDEAAKDGSCVLQKPRYPFCSTPCGSGNQCVEDDTCKPEPLGKDVGTAKVTGVKTGAGGAEVALTSTTPGSYLSAAALAYPPFDEGANVAVNVASGPYGAFTASAKGIAPLVVPDAQITLEKDKPLALTWTAKGASGDSTIHVHLDISHHGGTKGQIECDTADNGSLTIGASLVTQLINLGVAGFPTVRLTRASVGSTKISLGTIEMRAEHHAERAIVVPGHVSCTGDEMCPTGQTCQDDLQCK
jgi:hypothetical protein